MGGGIGQWLLYRAEDDSLSLFSLVVPSGSATPVHDHLAWGLVGLYRGEQDEEIYARDGDDLRLVERRALRPGDFYALLPPHDDIHRVRTTSAETSVSIHLLTNDTGCTWRHVFDPETGASEPFRSGYANVDCAPRRRRRRRRPVDAAARGLYTRFLCRAYSTYAAVTASTHSGRAACARTSSKCRGGERST